MCKQSFCLQDRNIRETPHPELSLLGSKFLGSFIFLDSEFGHCLKVNETAFPVDSNLYLITVSSHSTPKNLFV